MEPCAPAARAAREDVRVVQQPIEQRGHGGRVAEEPTPVLDGAVEVMKRFSGPVVLLAEALTPRSSADPRS